MLSFITDLFPAVYAEEKQEEAVEEVEETPAAEEPEEEEEPEDIKPEIEEGKATVFLCPFFFFFASVSMPRSLVVGLLETCPNWRVGIDRIRDATT